MADPAERPVDVVLGVGNLLMGDDALGVTAVDLLRPRWDAVDGLVLVDGGTWGMNLLPTIEGARRLLIIDAIDRGLAPGTRIALERDEVPRYFGLKLSPHQLDLREVLALADLRGRLPRQTIALGIQPARVELSLELSPELQRELPLLLDDIEDLLMRWGHDAGRGTRGAGRGSALGSPLTTPSPQLARGARDA